MCNHIHNKYELKDKKLFSFGFIDRILHFSSLNCMHEKDDFISSRTKLEYSLQTSDGLFKYILK